MPDLVIKEDVRLHDFQDPMFLYATKKKCFVWGNAPLIERSDHTFVGWRATSGNDGSSKDLVVARFFSFAFGFNPLKERKLLEKIT